MNSIQHGTAILRDTIQNPDNPQRFNKVFTFSFGADSWIQIFLDLQECCFYFWCCA